MREKFYKVRVNEEELKKIKELMKKKKGIMTSGEYVLWLLENEGVM